VHDGRATGSTLASCAQLDVTQLAALLFKRGIVLYCIAFQMHGMLNQFCLN
jgi:hypothetical protein